MAGFSLAPRDRVFFDLLREEGENALRTAELLKTMLEKWPDDREELGQAILDAEKEGDRLTHGVIQRLNQTFVTPFDREDIYGLASKIDDIVDYIDEVADFLKLYRIEAPMEQSNAMAQVLVSACEQIVLALASLRGFKGIEQYWIEIHRLENDGDRIYRDAVASLFTGGIDPMVVIRWKDIFTVLERAIDSTEDVAHIIEGVVIKNA